MYGVLTSAWNIIGGMAGQLDLSAGAYLGLGAYTTATLLLRWNITPWVGMFAGGAVAMGFAFLVGFPLFRFRIREVWYALSSSALVVVLQVVFLLWKQVGGPDRAPAAVGHVLAVQPPLPVLPALLLHHAGPAAGHPVHHLPHPHPPPGLLSAGPGGQRGRGRGPGGGRPGQQAEGPGESTPSWSGSPAGLYACIYGFVHTSFFSTTISMEVAILGIVGGMGIIYGPLTATVILVTGRELLRASLGGRLQSLYLVIYARGADPDRPAAPARPGVADRRWRKTPAQAKERR